MAKSQVPTIGPASVSVAGLGADQYAVAVLQGVRRHEVGDDGLQRRVVDRPAARVEEHDEDERAEVM